MNLHEYQAKILFAEYGIPVLKGCAVSTVEEARFAAESLNKKGGAGWVVKAQVHAGGRGKAGGVKLANTLDEVEQYAGAMLGSTLKTKQTAAEGLPIHTLLIEPTCDIKHELYLSAVINRSAQRISFIASAAGGMDIEEVAETEPEKVIRITIDPTVGLMAYQCRQVAFSLGLQNKQISELVKIMQGMYQLFLKKDASLIEVNPLVIMGNDTLLALDAKINLDDNALYRQKRMCEWRDETQEDAREVAAAEHELNYISLGGNIGCMVNGAGLAMATMDLIKLHGGDPANFLDVGGGTTAERVTEAFKLILSDRKVEAVLVNIFGGIVRCDLIAEGIIAAVKELQTDIPVVVRLEGTHVEQGRALLSNSGLKIIAAGALTDAAQKVVQAVGGQN